ncbi:molybdenum cofactor biosynthesis protein A [bacterium BMS3Abin03]|nr:molybdenum cofactor biosynthesis protein A [bacterium BMS3Abin03]
MELTFGPIPSRRLGRSLGINNIPPKICSYACVYCQLGNTLKMQNRREAFYKPEEIYAAVERRINQLEARGEGIDYLTFVPDGEPTLDLNLGKSIKLLKNLGKKIAVITNSSLIYDEDVRNDLMEADWVSLKVDAVSEKTWHKIDRPYGTMNYEKILDGMEIFSKAYKCYLSTETMLIKDVNDNVDEMQQAAEFIKKLNPKAVYISVPTRPPAEEYGIPPKPDFINKAYQIYSSKLDNVELTIGYEGNAFASTGNFEEDLLSITAVHPMRKEAVDKLMQKDGASWDVVEKLIEEKKIRTSEFAGNTFYFRNLKNIYKEERPG